MTANIFNIQRFCTDDGPGIRTTVFFKGCNLRCAWCHNPESQSAAHEWLFDAAKCTGCGRCAGISPSDTDFFCYHGAREACGKDYPVGELLAEVMKDAPFYESSGGGVTCSGGECMLQIDALEAFLKACKEKGLHTAVDTAGDVPYAYFKRVLPYTDLFLFDIKCLDSQKHEMFTGVPNGRILDNLACLLSSGARVWVRIPVIPTVNASEDEMHAVKALLDTLPPVLRVELLPYHALGEHKSTKLGKTPHPFTTPTEEEMSRLRAIFS